MKSDLSTKYESLTYKMIWTYILCHVAHTEQTDYHIITVYLNVTPQLDLQSVSTTYFPC